MPVEGSLVNGAETASEVHGRAAEDVNADFAKVYQEVVDRGGEVIAREVVLTVLQYEDVRYRQDTHLIVNFLEPKYPQA